MIRTCDIRFVMRDREREREPGPPVSARCPGPVIGWARSRVLTTCHTGAATCQQCTAVQRGVQLYSCHTSNIITSPHRQSVSNSGSSQTLVTKLQDILSRTEESPVNNWHLIEIRIVAVNDIDEEFYLWISWPWQSSWHCKYIFWLEEKSVCPKNSSCTPHFWDELYSHVTLTWAWVGNLLMWSEISSGTMLITKWPWHKTLMWWKNIRLIKIQQFSAAA